MFDLPVSSRKVARTRRNRSLTPSSLVESLESRILMDGTDIVRTNGQYGTSTHTFQITAITPAPASTDPDGIIDIDPTGTLTLTGQVVGPTAAGSPQPNHPQTYAYVVLGATHALNTMPASFLDQTPSLAPIDEQTIPFSFSIQAAARPGDPASQQSLQSGPNAISYLVRRDGNMNAAQNVTRTVTAGGTGFLGGTIDINYIPQASNASRTIVDGTSLTLAATALATDDQATLNFVQTGTVATANGQVVFNGTSLTYTPNSGFVGTDSFNFAVNDGRVNSATRTVTVDVLDAPPTLVRSFLSIAPGATEAVIGNDSLLVEDLEQGPAALVFTIDAAPARGSVVRGTATLGAGSTFTQAEINAGAIRYVRTDLAQTTDSLGFTFTDGVPGHEQTGTLQIRVGQGIQLPTITTFDPSNPPPVLSPNNHAQPSFAGTGAAAGSTILVKADIPGQGVQVVATAVNASGNWTATYSRGTPLPDGVYRFFATATVGGTESDSGPEFPVSGSIRIDTTPPSSVAVTGIIDDTGASGDFVTRDRTPTFRIRVGADNPASIIRVVLARAGQTGTLPEATTGSNGQVDLTYAGPDLTGGTYDFTVTATDDAGNSVATPVTVVVDPTFPTLSRPVVVDADPRSDLPNPVTQTATPTIQLTVRDQTFRAIANPVSVVITDKDSGQTLIDDRQTLPAGDDFATVGRNLSYTLPALSQGDHTLVIRATDLAGNVQTTEFRLFVNASGAESAGTTTAPVYGTVFDISQLLGRDGQRLDGGDPLKQEYPWSMSFDRTTQTVWVDLRGAAPGTPTAGGGNRILHIDPAGQTYKVYDLQDPDFIAAVNQKLTPLPGQPYRLDQSAPHGIAFDFESHLTPRVWFTQENGQMFSYIDVERNQVVVYDVRRILEANGIDADHSEPHAVAVDRRGVVWMTDQHEQKIYEFDPRGRASLDTSTGTLVIHEIPDSLRATDHDAGGPHGLEVVVSDVTNRATVYVTMLGTGRVLRLEAGQDVSGVDSAGDTWTEFELTPTDSGHPLFVTIDTNETPNDPSDDRLFTADPGRSGTTVDGNIRMIDLKSGTVTTWQIPRMPGGGDRPSQPNHAYVDREGNVFFIDRSFGVSRLDVNATFEPGSASLPSSTVPFKPNVERNVPERIESVIPVVIDYPSVPTRPLPLADGQPGQAIPNRSLSPGLDQYDLRGPNSGAGRGQGPFRGTFTAGNVLFGSLTQNDQFSSVVFADSARREMGVAFDPGTAAAPGVDRMAFQVGRDGHLILTGRAPGATGDSRVDLTAATNGPLLEGDVSAETDAAGVVHVFGKDRRTGTPVRYLYNPATRAWTTSALNLPAGATLGGGPSSFVDSTFGAGVMFTTGQGHLLVYYPGFSPDPADLTALAGAGGAPLYSAVGVAQAGDRIYAYGTDQTGSLIEYSYSVVGGPGSMSAADVRRIVDASDPAYRKANDKDSPLFLQDVNVAIDGTTRHVFAGDGAGRLVHVAIGPQGVIVRENVTLQLTPERTTGYSAYQAPFAGRVYGDVSIVIDPVTKEIFVYGTNGRDLVQFRQVPGGAWSVANLTNNVGAGIATGPANRVFGAPTAYVLADGSKHVFQINEDGEVVEYFQINRTAPFATRNLTLSLDFGGTPPNVPVPTLPTAPPGQPHPTKIGPRALVLAADPIGAGLLGAGMLQSPRDRLAFQFRATRSGRVSASILADDPNVVLKLAVFDQRGRRIPTRGASASFSVVEGRTYYILVQGTAQRGTARRPNARIGFGSFAVRVTDPMALTARVKARAVGQAHPRPMAWKR